MLSDRKIKSLNLSSYSRHIMICTGPKCCGGQEREDLWAYLKSRLDEEGLSNHIDASVFRTRAKCLRVCVDGPIAVVYPEGTWYRCLDAQGIDLIIQKHLKNGKVVDQYAFARNENMYTK